MKRREFIQYCGTVASNLAMTSVIAESLMIQTAQGQQVSVENLRRRLPPNEAMVLVPKDLKFAQYQIAFNKRTMLTPSVRVLCGSARAVAITLQWVQDNNVPLAMRSGGHSYEGLSQTKGLVIDTRSMDSVRISGDGSMLLTGAGAGLGRVYEVGASKGVAIPAGSCPTVGVTGHTTGGGYGLVARGFGLACDSLTSLQMVTANGEEITVSEHDNPDLFWACRGAGGGSFGVITSLQFRTHRVKTVFTFGINWRLSPAVAGKLMQAWQEWAPEAPHGINALLRVKKNEDGSIQIRCFGQTIGNEATLRTELARLNRVSPGTDLRIKRLMFLEAVDHFGGKPGYPSVYMKAKSDYLKKVMSDEGCKVFLANMPAKIVTVVFDSYGGEIRAKRDDETAFAHREDTLCSMQYICEWEKPEETETRMRILRKFHDSVRPYMSGGAYTNYCDLDIPDYLTAYWGNNVDRLIQVKNQYDPRDVFRHAQSVPLRRG